MVLSRYNVALYTWTRDRRWFLKCMSKSNKKCWFGLLIKFLVSLYPSSVYPFLLVFSYFSTFPTFNPEVNFASFFLKLLVFLFICFNNFLCYNYFFLSHCLIYKNLIYFFGVSNKIRAKKLIQEGFWTQKWS